MLCSSLSFALTPNKKLIFVGTELSQVWIGSTNKSKPRVLYHDFSIDPNYYIGIGYDSQRKKIYWPDNYNQVLLEGSLDGCIEKHALYSDLAFSHVPFIDTSNSRIFLSAVNDGIYVMPNNGMGPQNLIFNGQKPVTVVYDESSDNIYFGGPDQGKVFRGKADGTMLTELYDAPEIRDVEIYPELGLIFWVDLDQIWRAPLSGAGPKVVHATHLGGKLRSIEIDKTTQKLYLAEFNIPGTPGPDVIWSVNALSSGPAEIIYSGDFGSIRGLELVD